MTRTRKQILAGVAAAGTLGLVVGVLLVSCGKGWLVEKLKERVRASLGADLTVGNASFSPFSGKARLSGVKLARQGGSSDLAVSVEDVEVDVEVLPLLSRRMEVERIVLTRPTITVRVRKGTEGAGGGTLDKLKAYAEKKLLGKDDDAKRGTEWNIALLRITDGTLDYEEKRDGTEPFRARLSRFDYEARGVSPHAFMRLVWGADLSCDVEIGTQARLEKRGSASPSTLSLSGMDLGYADRFFDQEDALVVKSGRLDLSYTLGGDKHAEVRAKMQGLRVGQDPGSSSREFLFVPVEMIETFVSGKGGNLDLSFRLDEMDASADMEEVAGALWTGMWTALLKDAGLGSLRGVLDKGK